MLGTQIVRRAIPDPPAREIGAPRPFIAPILSAFLSSLNVSYTFEILLFCGFAPSKCRETPRRWYGT
jgi:hypothetical protein